MKGLHRIGGVFKPFGQRGIHFIVNLFQRSGKPLIHLLNRVLHGSGERVLEGRDPFLVSRRHRVQSLMNRLHLFGLLGGDLGEAIGDGLIEGALEQKELFVVLLALLIQRGRNLGGKVGDFRLHL